MLPTAFSNFIKYFSKLPSIGPRMAIRLAFYFIGLDKSSFMELENSFVGLNHLNRCGECFFIKNADEKICNTCSDPKRNKNLIAIVEKDIDILSLEKTKKFNGHYFILGALAEKGIFESQQKLRLEHLKNRIQKELNGKIGEIIVAVSPNSFGDVTFNLLSKELGHLTEKITRLGRGLPTGGEIEFADEETLGNALDNRNR